jgi:hypothetical protein
MVDHQHMGAVGVENPGPHDQLAEIVVADRAETRKGVTLDSCRGRSEPTQSGQHSSGHGFPPPDVFGVTAGVGHGGTVLRHIDCRAVQRSRGEGWIV